MRYEGITSDFSEFSKCSFESFAGIEVEDFPDDILFGEKEKAGKTVWKRGKYFNQWIEWRTSVIYCFLKEARAQMKAINPGLLFGDYTGAWYLVYYELGVNWASNQYDPSLEYDWATPNYKKDGYAELLDMCMSGLYFNEGTIQEVEKMNEEAMKNCAEAAMGKGREYWYSVEGSARLANSLGMGAMPVTGSIYVEQYQNDAEQFKCATSMALSQTKGLMIFDVVHVINHGWWNGFKEAIDDAKK